MFVWFWEVKFICVYGSKCNDNDLGFEEVWFIIDLLVGKNL